MSLHLPPHVAIVALFLALSLPILVAGDGTGDDSRRTPHIPLDLPSGGSGDDEEDEDSPETILFYGSEYEGEGFFWCLDKSGSMSGQRIATLKQEVISAINGLTQRAEIGITAFSSSYTQWQPQPVPANPSYKASALAWVTALHAGGSTHIAAAGVATVGLSNQASRHRKSVIVVSDGQPQDSGQALHDITAANFERTPVHTLLIGSGSGAQFLQTLAQMNGGTYREVQ